MKKLLGFLILMGIVGIARADESDLVYSLNRKVHYENAGVTTSTQIIMIDISDTVNYPHIAGQSMAVSKIMTTFVSLTGNLALSTGSIQLGVVSYVGASTGTVEWFESFPYYNTSTATVHYNDLIAPMYTRCYVSRVVNGDGATPYFGTNNISSGSSSYTVTGQLPTSLGGTAAPAIGDIILNINIGTGSLGRLIMDVYYAGVKP